MEKQIDITLLKKKTISLLTPQKVDFIRFVNVSGLSEKQNRGLSNVVLSSIGWIGKNNLLVTPEYGSALCLE
ncbi:hypothetical protein BOVA514_5242 [Bacteroides ovatus]|uniref:hypothetical protein n=1 Tax=Bacteroides ovatus TaxID=28116 RepID=UPI0020A73C6D|nr:hypothetical protein [Bacteroides ovatus]CAG9901105.1 hypothetical protein BOVA514_5242 [Bacteroides ovatus]